jgi:hypothetical protein
MESDFMLDDENYIDFIHNEEDLKKFNRLKEIWESGELLKPAKECLNFIIETDNLMNDLHGLPRRKFLIQNDPKLN